MYRLQAGHMRTVSLVAELYKPSSVRLSCGGTVLGRAPGPDSAIVGAQPTMTNVGLLKINIYGPCYGPPSQAWIPLRDVVGIMLQCGETVWLPSACAVAAICSVQHADDNLRCKWLEKRTWFAKAAG